jgi:putative Mn2+ efflux pump MntP
LIWKMAVLLFSLGIDNLLLSTAIGTSGVKNRIRLSLIFACFEGLMPAIGLLAGTVLSTWIGDWAFLIGLLAMAGLGVYLLIEDDEEPPIGEALKGWGLLLTGLSISIDELAVGVSFGLLDFPVWTTLAFLAIQAFVFTYLGLAFGAKLKPWLGEAAEKIAGVVLIAAALLLAVGKWVV